MAGNAHRNRAKKRCIGCLSGCKFCAVRPKYGEYRNSNGNRHNPASKRRGKRPNKH